MKGFKMDMLELKIKDEIGKFYQNASSDELDKATENLIDFYKLVVKIMQENQTPKIPENSSENAKK